jgi:hypothetical protein
MSNTDVLLIATMDGAENCARLIGDKVGSRVAVAPNKREGLSALRQSQFAIVMVQESLMEADPVWSDLVWELAGSAISVQVNFAISGCNRLAREVKAALMRQDGERAAARRAAVTAVENDLKSSVTSLLLESELALREPAIPASLEPKLRHLVELAGALRERLRGETDSRG